MSKWIALRTKGNHERKAEIDVRRSGYEVFLPLVEEERVISRRRLKMIVAAPLFRTYLFVFLGERQVWAPLKDCIGVLGVVRGTKNQGDIAAAIPQKIIDAIRARLERDGGVVKPSNPWDEMSYGEPVALMARIVSGPAQGHVGLFQRSGPGRVASMLGMMRLDLSAHHVQLIDPPEAA